MREFTKISPRIWSSPEFKELKLVDERLLYFYYLTSRHQTTAGCCFLPDAYAREDLGWPSKMYQARRQRLISAGVIQFDPETNELFVTRWCDDNGPMNP